MFQGDLGIPTVLMGFALPDARIHAPNERLHLPTFFRSVQTCQAFLDAIGTTVASHSELPGRQILAVR